MRRGYVLLLAWTLAVCGSAHAQTSGLDAEINVNVGKDYWLTGAVNFCQKSLIVITNCTPLTADTPTHLKIGRVETYGIVPGRDYYYVTLDDGRTGYIGTYDLLGHGTDIDPAKAAADCKRRGLHRCPPSAAPTLTH